MNVKENIIIGEKIYIKYKITQVILTLGFEEWKHESQMFRMWKRISIKVR